MSFFLSIVALTNLFCVSFAQEGGFKQIDDVWCNDSSYSCFPKWGEVCVKGKLKCGDVITDYDEQKQNDKEACLTLLYAYCNADPKCKAFQRYSKWSSGFYFPCSTQDKQEWQGAMMFANEEMEDTLSEECRTNGGQTPNVPCIFPFIGNGITFNECVFIQGSYMCATKVDSSGNAIEGHVGTCSLRCPGTVLGGCTNTDAGHTDRQRVACEDYIEHIDWCGEYDDNDFQSNDMCCICGGGSTKCFDKTNGHTDEEGAGCDYYEQYPDLCGSWDTNQFTATTMCCACKDMGCTVNGVEGDGTAKGTCDAGFLCKADGTCE